GVLCVAAISGLWVVTVALHELFDLRVDRLGVDACIVVGCAIILIYLHRLRADDAPGGGRIPELWRRLASAIGAPFVATVLAILVAYEVAARVRGELPRNMLSPLIIAAGLVGWFSTLIISSVLDQATGTGVLSPADPHRWARRWSVRLTRAFPVVVLALLPMAWWALGIRVDEHGITPFRAVRGFGLLCLTGLSVLGAWRWLRGRAAPSWEVPAAIAGFALVAAFGPVSAVQLSIRSQSQRLAGMLGELEAGRRAGDPSRPGEIELDPARHDELHDAVRLISQLGGEPALRRALDGAAVTCSWDGRRCPERLDVYRRGHDVAPVPVGDNRVMAIAARGRFALPAGQPAGEIESFELHRPTDDGDVPPRSAEPAGARSEALWLTADRVLVHVDGTVVAQASLAALLAPRPADAGLPLTLLPAVRPDGTIAADLAISLLDVWVAADRPPQPRRLTGIVIWRR
ncbi:MAG TPA: hypothetical protein VK601_01590, partial [Kofleriaceae bacterium]|nr:hypothetical protein [Kofleriaceae bacterium]